MGAAGHVVSGAIGMGGLDPSGESMLAPGGVIERDFSKRRDVAARDVTGRLGAAALSLA